MSSQGLSCQHCTKSYGRLLVLDDVTLRVLPGEVVGLVGPNGAGKTTLLHSIVGLAKLDSGNITVNGVPASAADAKRQLAFMPDDLPRPKNLTATEILKLTCNLYGADFDAEEAEGLATRLEIDHRLDHVLSGYSHGMARKVDLLSALMVSPSVLVLDEPFSGMDPVVVEVICELIQAGQELGRATLLSTHDLELAAKVASRIVMVDKGRVIFDDTLEELTNRQQTNDIRQAFKTIARG